MRATLKGDSRAVPVLCGCMIFLCLRFISGCSGLHARPDRPKSLCMDILGIRCRHLRHAPCSTLQRDSLCSLQRHARTCRPRNRMLQAAYRGQTAPDKTAEPVCAGDRRFCALRYRSRIWRSHGRNSTAWNTFRAASSCKNAGRRLAARRDMRQFSFRPRKSAICSHTASARESVGISQNTRSSGSVPEKRTMIQPSEK